MYTISAAPLQAKTRGPADADAVRGGVSGARQAMRKTLLVAVGAAALLAAGCLSRHELVIEPNETLCQAYGITEADLKRAVARGPRDVKSLGQTVVKVLPDGTVVRLRQVARLRYRELMADR
jgi:hypothetical protein